METEFLSPVKVPTWGALLEQEPKGAKSWNTGGSPRTVLAQTYPSHSSVLS